MTSVSESSIKHFRSYKIHLAHESLKRNCSEFGSTEKSSYVLIIGGGGANIDKIYQLIFIKVALLLQTIFIDHIYFHFLKHDIK